MAKLFLREVAAAKELAVGEPDSHPHTAHMGWAPHWGADSLRECSCLQPVHTDHAEQALQELPQPRE